MQDKDRRSERAKAMLVTRVSEETHRRLKALAARERRSIAQQTALVIEQGLQAWPEQAIG